MLLPQIVLRANQHHSISRLRICLPKSQASILQQSKKPSLSKRTAEKTTSSGSARNTLLNISWLPPATAEQRHPCIIFVRANQR